MLSPTPCDFGLNVYQFAVLSPNLRQLRTLRAPVCDFESELRVTSDSAGIRSRFCVRTPAIFGLSRHPFAFLGPNSSQLRTQPASVRSFMSELQLTSNSASICSRFCVQTPAIFGLCVQQFAVLCPNPSHLRTLRATVRGFVSELRPTSDSAGIRSRFCVRTPASFGLSRHLFAVLCPNSSHLRTQPASVRGFVSELQSTSDSAGIIFAS